MIIKFSFLVNRGCWNIFFYFIVLIRIFGFLYINENFLVMILFICIWEFFMYIVEIFSLFNFLICFFIMFWSGVNIIVIFLFNMLMFLYIIVLLFLVLVFINILCFFDKVFMVCCWKLVNFLILSLVWIILVEVVIVYFLLLKWI